jgi:triacylglycerol lipase
MRDVPRLLVMILFFGCGERLAARPSLSLDPLPARTDQIVVEIAGRASPGAQIRLEGAAAPASAVAGADGRFRAMVSLRVGARNRIQVYPMVGDLAGYGREVIIEQFVVERLSDLAPDAVAPPAPLLDSLPPAVGSTAVALRGIAEPGATVVVRDPYRIQRIPADAVTGRFSTTVRLRIAAPTSIVVAAEDPAGNRSPEVVATLRHDPSLAAVPAERPPPPTVDPLPAAVAATRVTLAGLTVPWGQVRVDGGEAPAAGVADGEGRFAVGVALRLGTLNELAVRAVDDAGREGEVHWVRLAQTQAPRGTRYPLVLAHGFGGAERVLGILPYWWKIREALEADGHEVLVGDVSPYHSIEHRAAQLRDQIDRYTSGRVNLIGHSMGGLDSRYLISRLGFGSRAASLTTLSTPHLGSKLADLALGAAGPQAFAAADFFFRLAGYSLEGVRELTTIYVRNVFNPRTVDDPRVRYFSWGGRADPLGHTGNVLAPYFVATWTVLHALEGDNDGLVSVTSSRWGEYLGTLAADHLDEIGQLFGSTDSFDHLAFYRQVAADLQAQGF